MAPHPGDDAGRFDPGIRGRDRQSRIQQVVQASGFRESEGGDQASGGHHVRVIEFRADRVRSFHLRGVPLVLVEVDVVIHILPAQEGTSISRHAHTPHQRRWIRAEDAPPRSRWQQR